MNVDSPSDSKNLSSCEVTSKYFGSKGVMDESLSDFQEKKNFSAKNSQKAQKPSTSKSKPKKHIKKIRGQKDIRKVLNKKNELIAYSNDFEKICKQSGIDVDSEQLQLAIALSKSLQQAEAEVKEENNDSNPLSAQERTGKIRTTLQEYGFVVPEVKITVAKSRKQKKYRKNYKLLQTTEAEKQQVISDKYSQVLFHNLVNTKETDCSYESNESIPQLYHIGTNIFYEELKDNNLLYVEDLLQKSPNFVGCLLKNWAEIPGRPVSPTLKPPCIQFDKVNCTQEELDIVLSGLIKAAQDIVKNKSSSEEEEIVTVNKSEHCSTDIEESSKMDIDCIEILEHEETESNKLGPSCNENKPIEVIDIEDPKLLTVTQNVRSCSPDIFDDEVSEILDSPVQTTDVLSEELLSVDRSKPYTDIIMDLTECVNLNSQTAIVKPIPQLPLSQGSHTKRKSDDFMDVTECVIGSSQAIRENMIINENIDLTQNSDEDNIAITKQTTKEQNMDLTQSSDTNEDLPVVQISGNKSLDDTIILNEDAYNFHFNNTAKNFLGNNNPGEISRDININIKSARFSEESQPSSSFSTHDKASITIDSEDESDNHTTIQNEELEERAISPIECLAYDNELEFGKETLNKSIEAFNMAEKHSKSSKFPEDNVTKSKTESFFEEFVHRHSESSSQDNTDDNSCVHKSLNNSVTIESNSKNTTDDIDLTQETDTSEEVTEPPTKIGSPKILFDSSHLGKIGEVSIDYDELFDDMVRKTSSSSTSKTISSRSQTTDYNSENNIEKPNNSDLVSNSSQNSEAFNISDKELDYSLNKSRLLDNPEHNFEFGGVSVVNNLLDLPSFRSCTNNIENRSFSRSLSESYLPVVEIKGSAENENRSKSSSTSPTSKISRKEIITKTPKNGEYIIKTDGVTPMLDYERMTTPERNAELDKYGIKPFKRKRAVQLLTHLYNQTHPIVESLENLPSPSKRFKPSTTSPIKPSTSKPTSNPQTSPTKRKSPRKCFEMSKPQKKVSKSNINAEEEDEREVIDKENDIYDITSEIPDIRNIECSEEDWVFQKREKAKVHSCRVPLHIAFHNYVSARQRLLEAILRYEPVNIDVIHKGLVSCGLRYDPKDLLKFMDKKCITVKTADNNGRNKKHY